MQVLRPKSNQYGKGSGDKYMTAGVMYPIISTSERYCCIIDDTNQAHILPLDFLWREDIELLDYSELNENEQQMLKMIFPKEFKDEC